MLFYSKKRCWQLSKDPTKIDPDRLDYWRTNPMIICDEKGVPLTEEGKKEIKEYKERLKKLGIDYD